MSASSYVVLRNAKAKLYRKNGVPILEEGKAVVCNIQRDSRSILPELIKGLDIDLTQCYRIRLDLLPGSQIMRTGELILIDWQQRGSALLGWWTLWADSVISSGSLPTMKCYVKREYNAPQVQE